MNDPSFDWKSSRYSTRNKRSQIKALSANSASEIHAIRQVETQPSPLGAKDPLSGRPVITIRDRMTPSERRCGKGMSGHRSN